MIPPEILNLPEVEQIKALERRIRDLTHEANLTIPVDEDQTDEQYEALNAFEASINDCKRRIEFLRMSRN